MVSEAATDDDTVSNRERLDDFVDAIGDVPGVVAAVNGFGVGGAYATVNVDFDYGDRHEYGNGNVCVADDADDPVGREAFDRDLRIVRVTPQPSAERVKLWVAHESAYVEDAIARYARSIVDEGDVIGYHPNGNEDVRQVGVVKDVRDVDVVVTLDDDPGIEEKVRYEHIRAHRTPDE